MDRLDHPLRFQPLFRRYLWGGRRLGEVFGKPIGPESDYAESWEIVDRAEDQSVVQYGPLKGTTLSQLVNERGKELFGRKTPCTRFPLLFKLLDATSLLSVQVHPNDEQASRQTPPDLGKTEAWVILAADPGAYLYAGLKEGVTRDDLIAKVADGTCEECLCRIEPSVGDCYFLPAGVIHALGPGLLVAEIQQSSDTTFRLFDWNRVDKNGKGRQLHLQEAYAVINYAAGPSRAQVPRPDGSGAELLVDCDKFRLRRRRASGEIAFNANEGMRLVIVIEGELELADDPANVALKKGEVALLPANYASPKGRCARATTLLEVTLP
jgi:mannose-6-phosphate isomerase